MKTISSFALLAFVASAIALVGCGDGLACPSNLVVVIQSPADGTTVTIAADLDPNIAGIQANVEIRSNVSSGTALTLNVTDDTTGDVAQHTVFVDSSGGATFTSVTLPEGPVTLSTEGSSACGLATDTAAITVITEAKCTLTIDEGTIANDFFAPIPVLNTSNDSNVTLANFQANVTVESPPGFTVELFVLDVEAGSEASVGNKLTGLSGESKFQTTLAQGRQVLRATCTHGATALGSAANAVQVDTVVPSCTLTNPEEGISVTPADDEDGNDQNGIQMTFVGKVDDAGEADIAGEATSFFRDATEYAGSSLTAAGDASTSLAEFTSPGSYELAFVTQDHAGNLCSADFTTTVAMEGCEISMQQPSGAGTVGGIVVADSDGIGINGLQADLVVQVDAECAGQEVFVDCGAGETFTTAPANGTTTVSSVTLNPLSASQGTAPCTARVLSVDGIETSDQITVGYDTAGSNILLRFIEPAPLACGDTLVANDANDADGVPGNGFQISLDLQGGSFGDTFEFRVIGPSCAGPDGCVTAFENGPTMVTLQIGDNDIQGVAEDSFGNVSFTGACNINLVEIDLDFDAPVSTGVLNAAAGTVNISDELELLICGTVSEDTVVLTVGLDGGPAMPTTVSAGAWCTDALVALTAGPHTLVASATSTADGGIGGATANVSVDISAPNQPTGFGAFVVDRQSINANWSAQGDANTFMLRASESVFTDAGFRNEGIEFPVGAATSGSITQLSIGTAYYIGVAAVDLAGNVSIPATLGIFRPLLDATGSIYPPNYQDGFHEGLGHDMVFANFNGDEYDDLVVAAPYSRVGSSVSTGEVHIYLGSAIGISATPDLTLFGPEDFGRFGFSLTAINWGGGSADGLAVAAPYGDNGNGQVFIYHADTIAAALLAGDDLAPADADLSLKANPADTSNWFTGGSIGISLAAGRVDGDAIDDLIIGVSSGGSGSGGVAIVYGGAPMDSAILLSDSVAAGMKGLVGHIFANPEVLADNALLGWSVEYLGETSNSPSSGDISVAYFADTTDLIDDRVFVLRGRTTLPSSGMEFTTLEASDLTIVLEGSAGAADNTFGARMGSIQDQGVDGFRDILISKGGGADSRLFIIDGSQTGTLTLNNTSGFLTNIAPTSGALFATGVANNAEIGNPDINNDGLEDLLVVGGQPGVGDGVQMHIWLSGDIPSGAGTTASATHQISAPATFDGVAPAGQKQAREVQWAGDVNGDGLADICWADYYHRFGGSDLEGNFEVLYDADE